MSTDPRPILIRQIAALPRVIETLNTLAWRDVMSDALPEMDALVVDPPPRPPRQRAPGEFFVGDLVELARSRPLGRTFSARPGARAFVTRENYPVAWLAKDPQINVSWTNQQGVIPRNQQSDGGYPARDFDLVRAAGAMDPDPEKLRRLRDAENSLRKFEAALSGISRRNDNSRPVVELVIEQLKNEIAGLRKSPAWKAW